MLPDHVKTILRSLWVYKSKADGRCKSRLTVDGRLNFVANTYASVATKECLRMLLSFAITMEQKAIHVDVSNAFLYGFLVG